MALLLDEFDRLLYRIEPVSTRVSINEIDPALLNTGKFYGNMSITEGYMQSDNFVTGSTGWQATAEGNLEANSGTFRGSLIAGSIDIPDTTTANSMHVESDGDTYWGANVATGFAGAPASIGKDGAGKFSSITITGGAISGVPISSIPNSTVTDISLLTLTHDLVFSVTDADTIAWASGTITMANGRTFSIDAGNTGNMAALTYIYLDPDTSATVLQTTTTYSTAIGADKALIGTAQNQTVTASFIPQGGGGKALVDGSQIGALSIVAGNIAASTITAGKMNVSTLSAITADVGTITAGSITGLTITGGTIRTSTSGARIELTAVGDDLTLYNSSGESLFSLNDSSSSVILFNPRQAGALALFQNAGATNHTGNLLNIEMTRATSTGDALRVNNEGTGDAATFIAAGTGIALRLTSNESFALSIVHPSQSPASSAITINNDTDGASIFIDQDVDSSNNGAAIAINYANVGSGTGLAFDLSGDVVDMSATAVATVTGVVKILTSEGIRYLPIYTSFS